MGRKWIGVGALLAASVLLTVSMASLRTAFQPAPPAQRGSGPTASPTLPAPTSTAVLAPDPRDTNREVEMARLSQASARSKEVRPTVELPRHLRIDSVGIDSPFERVGLTPDGAMDVPKDPARAGWYSLGPRPGEKGNALVAGHVDWGGKPAAFWGLVDVRPGDLVEVTAADGKQYDFVVQWQRWFDAEETQLDSVFGQTPASELTLITCGGAFDKQKRQYLSRLVVRAIAK